jgi:hypothetical protein
MLEEERQSSAWKYFRQQGDENCGKSWSQTMRRPGGAEKTQAFQRAIAASPLWSGHEWIGSEASGPIAA